MSNLIISIITIALAVAVGASSAQYLDVLNSSSSPAASIGLVSKAQQSATAILQKAASQPSPLFQPGQVYPLSTLNLKLAFNQADWSTQCGRSACELRYTISRDTPELCSELNEMVGLDGQTAITVGQLASVPYYCSDIKDGYGSVIGYEFSFRLNH